MTKLRLFLAASALVGLLASTPAPVKADVLGLDFSGGTGTGSYDQYTGATGGGWNGGWTTTAPVGTIATANPLDGGGNYLSVTSSATGFIRRDYNSQLTAPALNVGQTHIVQFQHRLDSVGAGFDDGGARVRIFDNPTATTGTSGSNTWILGVGNSGQWQAANGNKAGGFGTNIPVLAHSLGTTYDIAIRTKPGVKEWDVHISDGVNHALVTDLGWRDNPSTAGTFIHFGQDNNGAGAGTTNTFSLDAIALSNGTRNWTEVGTADWFRMENWSSQGKPTIFDSVTINNGGTAVLDSPTNRRAFAGSLNVASGALEVTSPLYVAGAMTVDANGEIRFNGENMSLTDGLIEVTDLTIANGATIVIDNPINGGMLIDFSGTFTGSIDDITVQGEGWLYLDPLTSSLNVAVPEPATFALWGSALAGLIGMHVWRRRKR